MSEDALTPEDVRDCYGKPSVLARDKVMTRLDGHARAFIARSPFVVLGTADVQGRQDVSPRGDPPGFVRVLDERTLALPDRPGNRRIDSLANVASQPNVALLFIVPGFDDTLRVNGHARISRDPALLASLAVDGKPALSALVVEVEEVFMHCAKAFIRSRLWKPDAQQNRREFPSLGRIIADQVAGVDAAAADVAIDENYRTELY
ncbi:pyridoxamine 5'-phosphate oxidase family protein [Geminicoccus harenae]|uniref:pyridoxamine 5'-phosphate oxidase family protein n=1 Tax=Geminicoccus harenae TaxID=2498453 RepID=UPI00168C04CC|nr:pyridoxamine 5'-phosphate oxidase family protein [Geminicoccus harenae]